MSTRYKSNYAKYERISPNSYARNNTVKRTTPHHVVGKAKVEAILGLAHFVNPGGTSCNYAIGFDGVIGLGVPESRRAITSSSSINDNQAITCEISNDGGAPNWHVSKESVDAWIALQVDICAFYGFKGVKYMEKPAHVTFNTVENWIKTWEDPEYLTITLHQWFAATECPGDYLLAIMPTIANEINRVIAENAKGGQIITPITPPITPPAPSTEEFKEYTIRITATALNVRTGPGTNYPITQTLTADKNLYTIVEEANGAGSSKWGKLKSGAGWIALNYTRKA